MKEFAELDVEMEDLVLLHEDDIHFNLIISKDSDLVKYGSLSKRLNCDENSDDSDGDFEKDELELITVKNEVKRYKTELEKTKIMKSKVEKEYQECKAELYRKTEEVEKLKVEVDDLRTIVKLRNELSKDKHDDSVMEVDEVVENPVSKATVLESMTKSGYEGKNIQNESMRMYPCAKCNFKAISGSLLARHMQTIHIDDKPFSCNKSEEVEVSYKTTKIHQQNVHTNGITVENVAVHRCYKCGYKALNDFLLRRHINSKHEDERVTKIFEDEFNCEDCDFQGTNEEHLKKHFRLKHEITCRNCNEQFKEKRMLMIHRKQKHPNSVAPCRKYIIGDCTFTSESCFWSHENKENGSQSISCYICDKTFQNKHQVMNHRKLSHPTYIEPCVKYMKEECPFQSKFCWFKHTDKHTETSEEENVATDNDSVFQEATKIPKPPLKPQENKA